MKISEFEWEKGDIALFAKTDSMGIGYAVTMIFGGFNQWYIYQMTGNWSIGESGLPDEGMLLLYNGCPVKQLDQT